MNKKTRLKIEQLCIEGDEFADDMQLEDALEKYKEALTLIPKPWKAHEESTWILAVIGDLKFLTKDFKDGVFYFGHTLDNPDAVGNPFIHLRLGQCHFELGNFDRAREELLVAYEEEGEEVFKEDNEKYLTFLLNDQ